jgi:uncharacterized protein
VMTTPTPTSTPSDPSDPSAAGGRARSSADRFGSAVARRSAATLVAAVVATALLAVPFLTMGSDEFASQEPSGPVFDARDALDERFGGGVVAWTFIVEAQDGDLLDRKDLLALQERLAAVRADARFGPVLVERTDPVTGAISVGATTLADAVDGALAGAGLGGLAGADDAAVRTVTGEIVDQRGPAAAGISTLAERDDTTGWWSAPAAFVTVLADGDALEGRGAGGGFGSDSAVELAGRGVRDILRDGEGLDVFGVALDQNLTGEEQGEAAGPFIGFTVLAAVALVGVAFASYWTLAVVGAGLIALLVWLQGLTNLIGLKDDQILATIVPIAMIAFGVDYAFHAVGRYREELRNDHDHRRALAHGLAGVTPALLLALATGAFAFLANTVSGIESITQFGIAAAVALTSAFLVLGIVVPVAVATIERRVADRRPRFARPLAVAGGVGAAATAMAAVLFTVFLDPVIGLVLLVGYVMVFVVAPAWIVGRLPIRFQLPAVPTLSVAPGAEARPAAPSAEGRLAAGIGRAVTSVAARRMVVLPVVAILTGVAATYAAQVPAAFDVEDFFAADTDFVLGLDKVDEHVGDQGGEEAVVYVSSDLRDPAAAAAVTGFVERVADLDTLRLARAADGRVDVGAEALGVLAGTSGLTAAEADQLVAPPDDDGFEAIRLSVGLVGSRAQENVEEARELLEPLVADLDDQLSALHPGSEAVLTGTPIVRQASLDAVSDSLLVSVPIAVLLCLSIAWGAMRSLRYAVVSLVPILLVVAWLYGFMFLAGFSVNLVTATIGAISVGIGIDYAIHLTMRYREELVRTGTRTAALHAAAAGTGVALVGSSLSSIAGFAILAFAPMPMFASYGLLTAVMIALALLSSLLVLPGLLLMVSRDRIAAPEAVSAAGRGGPDGAVHVPEMLA